MGSRNGHAAHETLVKHLQSRIRQLAAQIDRRIREQAQVKAQLAKVLTRRREG